jgi:hypothetical protein
MPRLDSFLNRDERSRRLHLLLVLNARHGRSIPRFPRARCIKARRCSGFFIVVFEFPSSLSSLSLLSKGVQTQAHIQYGPSEVSLNGASTQSCNYSASNLPYLTSISPAQPLPTCFNLILTVRGRGGEAYFGFKFPDFFDGKCIPGRDRNLRGRTGLL